MKKALTVLALSTLVSFNVFASETEHLEHHEMEKEGSSKYYIAVKGVMTLGDSVKETEGEEVVTVDGDTGAGISLDLGYKLPYGFAVEVDVIYVQNDVTIKSEDFEDETFTASYISTSLDLAYKYNLTHDFGLVAKVGYEYEYETIDGDSTDDTGFIYAAGAEYEVGENVLLVAEYEGSTIDGPRGDAIFAGVVYEF